MAEIVVRLTKAQARALVCPTMRRVQTDGAFGYRYRWDGPPSLDWRHGVRRSAARQQAEARVLSALYDAFPELSPAAGEQEAMTS